MTEVTLNNSLGSMEEIPELKEIASYLMHNPVEIPPEFKEFPIAGIGNMGWSPEGMVNGLNFLIRQFTQGAKPYFVYSEEECQEDPQKRDVNIVRLIPEKIDPHKPYIILVAGGGYQTVCSAVESYPTAVHMVKRGYQVFVLTYRVGGKGILPKTLEDLAAALRVIEAHAAEFQLKPDSYAIGGYSAGANLICTWAMPHVGYKVYGMAKPMVMFPVYTFIDLKSLQKQPEMEVMLHTMLGDKYTQPDLDKYDVVQHITKEYPPCYIVCGKDDTTIPCRNSEMLKEYLDTYEVHSILEEGEHAPHGFGDGTGTEVEGWADRAINFLEEVKREGNSIPEEIKTIQIEVDTDENNP